jgi:hypothetical protein
MASRKEPNGVASVSVRRGGSLPSIPVPGGAGHVVAAT